MIFIQMIGGRFGYVQFVSLFLRIKSGPPNGCLKATFKPEENTLSLKIIFYEKN